MLDPIFWLGLSFLLVAISLTAVLVVAIPTMRELARMARSAEKLFDTLAREMPPTLEAIRNTGREIIELTDDMTDGVKSAGEVVKQVDRSITGAKRQVNRVQTTTRTVMAGVKAAWRSFSRSKPASRRSPDYGKPGGSGNPKRLPPGGGSALHLDEINEINVGKGGINYGGGRDRTTLPDGSTAFPFTGEFEDTPANPERDRQSSRDAAGADLGDE